MDDVYVYQEGSGGSTFISKQESLMSFDRTTKNSGFGEFEAKAYEIICSGFIVRDC